MENEVKKLMNIPKKATLRHYINLVGQLYGEPRESLDVYIEEQVKANENNLDAAIACFEGMVPSAEDLSKSDSVRRLAKWAYPKK